VTRCVIGACAGWVWRIVGLEICPGGFLSSKGYMYSALLSRDSSDFCTLINISCGQA
jgi:hypothetical protein